MHIDPSVPGYCQCHRPYEPAPRGPYPYLKDAAVEALPVTKVRACRILPPLPIPETFRNGLANERTPRVICAGSDVRTTERRRRQREADAEAHAEAQRSRRWQGVASIGGPARRAARANAGAVFAR